MSANINLAPEVYQSSQRNKHNKRLATTVTVAISVLCGGLIVVLLVIILGQKSALTLMQKDIDSKKNELKQIPDIQRAVTLSDHLNSWDQLNSSKPSVSEFFKVLQTFAPQGVAVSGISINDSNILQVDASSKGYSLATKFAKALDAANVEIGPNAAQTATPYFSGTELSAVSQESNGIVTFKLTTQMSSEVTNGKN